MKCIVLFISMDMKLSKATICSSVWIILEQANILELIMANNVVFLVVLIIILLIFAVSFLYKIEMKDLI